MEHHSRRNDISRADSVWDSGDWELAGIQHRSLLENTSISLVDIRPRRQQILYRPSLSFLLYDFRPLQGSRIWTGQELNPAQRLGNRNRESVSITSGTHGRYFRAELFSGESAGNFGVLHHLQKVRPANQERIVNVVCQYPRNRIDISMIKIKRAQFRIVRRHRRVRHARFAEAA